MDIIERANSYSFHSDCKKQKKYVKKNAQKLILFPLRFFICIIMSWTVEEPPLVSRKISFSDNCCASEKLALSNNKFSQISKSEKFKPQKKKLTLIFKYYLSAVKI